jgi:hypothetical protein
VADTGRRRRILAQVGGLDTMVQAHEVVNGICQYAVERLVLSGCAVMLMSAVSTLDVFAAAGPRALELAELQFSLGEGPCLDAHHTGRAVFAADLAGHGARWPVFSSSATELGVLAEFSLPLQVGATGLGTLDLSRTVGGMLTDDDLADALVVADITTDALLTLQNTEAGVDLSRMIQPAGRDRLVVHQATGMVAVQLGGSTADALASIRAAAFRTDRSIYEIAVDVVAQRLRFRE